MKNKMCYEIVELPPPLLKQCTSELASPLSQLINKFIKKKNVSSE